MCIKGWSNDPWVCPVCGAKVEARHTHGVDDCIKMLLIDLKHADHLTSKVVEERCTLEIKVQDQQAVINTLERENNTLHFKYKQALRRAIN